MLSRIIAFPISALTVFLHSITARPFFRFHVQKNCLRSFHSGYYFLGSDTSFESLEDIEGNSVQAGQETFPLFVQIFHHS